MEEEFGEFDVMAHLDIFRRVLVDKYYFENNLSDWNEVADLLLEKDIGFEVNTSGMRFDGKDFYPSEKLISFLIKKGIRKITIGSDSHKYEHIGSNYEAAREFLKSNGIKRIFYFKKREAVPYPL